MLRIDLNANKLHIIQSWENWKNALLLDLAHDSCFPPSLSPLRAVTRTKPLQFPCLLFCYWFISRTNHVNGWWMFICARSHRLPAWWSSCCTTVASVRFTAGRAGCTWRLSGRCCGRRLSQVQWEAPRDFFAQASLTTPVEFNLKCVQLNYHQRTVHGRVDFHLFQSGSLTNISFAATPQVPLACLFPWQHIIRQNLARYAGIQYQLCGKLIKKKNYTVNSITANKLTSMESLCRHLKFPFKLQVFRETKSIQIQGHECKRELSKSCKTWKRMHFKNRPVSIYLQHRCIRHTTDASEIKHISFIYNLSSCGHNTDI